MSRDVRAAVERPRLREVGGAQRLLPVVLERRSPPRRCRGRRCRGTCRTAAFRTTCWPRAMLSGELGIGRRRWSTGLGARRELRRQRLDVRDDVVDVVVGEDAIPCRHRRAVQALSHRSDQVVVGRHAAGFGRADLVLAGREIARARRQERGGRAVALAGRRRGTRRSARRTPLLAARLRARRAASRLRASRRGDEHRGADGDHGRNGFGPTFIERSSSLREPGQSCRARPAPSRPRARAAASASGISRPTTGFSVPFARPATSAAWIAAKSRVGRR